MKAIIKIVSANHFTSDQTTIMKRVCLVLIEHNLSVAMFTKEKSYARIETKKHLKLKAV